MAELSPRLRARLSRVPESARRAAQLAMEQGADEIVKAMRSAAPAWPQFRERINWAWPDQVPAGSFVIDEIRSGKNKGDQYATMRVVFYVATGLPQGNWVEFGTQPHSVARGASVERGKFQDKGPHHPGTAAHPFFFPTWESQKAKFNRRIRKAVRDAVKKDFRNG